MTNNVVDFRSGGHGGVKRTEEEIIKFKDGLVDIIEMKKS